MRSIGTRNLHYGTVQGSGFLYPSRTAVGHGGGALHRGARHHGRRIEFDAVVSYSVLTILSTSANTPRQWV